MFNLQALAVSVLAVVTLSGCYDVETDARPCDTHQDCVEDTDGDLDYCGQEGLDLCCKAGKYKCGCIGDATCIEGYECYVCTEELCTNGQPTICLDGFGGTVGGLELVGG